MENKEEGGEREDGESVDWDGGRRSQKGTTSEKMTAGKEDQWLLPPWALLPKLPSGKRIDGWERKREERSTRELFKEKKSGFC